MARLLFTPREGSAVERSSRAAYADSGRLGTWALKVCRGGEALKPKTSRARVVASGGFKTSGLAGRVRRLSFYFCGVFAQLTYNCTK